MQLLRVMGFLPSMCYMRVFVAHRKLFLFSALYVLLLKRFLLLALYRLYESFVAHRQITFFFQPPLSVHVLDKWLKRFLLLALMFTTREFCCTSQNYFLFSSSLGQSIS